MTLKPNTGTAKSACELSLEPPLSDVDRLDAKAGKVKSAFKIVECNQLLTIKYLK